MNKKFMNKKKLCFIMLGMVFSFLFVLNAQAANHFVRQGATSGGNGADWNNAYPSLPATLVRGDTYFIASGSYPGRTFNTPVSGTALITIKKAIEKDHGTGTGWLSSYGTGQAAFTSMIEFATSNWVFDGQTGGGAANNWNQNLGFKITETGDANPMILIGYNTETDNITIRHVEFQGKGSITNQGGGRSNDAVEIWSAKNVTVSYYWMHGIGRCPFFTGGQNVIAEHGWVQSYFFSGAVHSEIASIWKIGSTLGDHTFRYNLFTDLEGTGGLMWDNSTNNAAHMYVYGNVFYKPTGAFWEQQNGVIGGWTGANNEQARNILVYNNTFIGIDNQQIFATLPRVYSGNVVMNNLFYNTKGIDYSIIGTHDYNLYINSGGTLGEANSTSATLDPFVNYVGLDFRLKAHTASGSSLPSPYNIDPLENARGTDGVIDRGAFQFISNTALLAPPTQLKTM